MPKRKSRNIVAETLRQVIEGDDFSSPKALLSRVNEEAANKTPPGAPYNIATQVLHADFWNRIWLARLKGEKRPNMLKDWRVPSPEEWEGIRASFLAGLAEAQAIAKGEPLKHEMRSDKSAQNTLLACAVHTAYHLGQIFLLKRMLKSDR